MAVCDTDPLKLHYDYCVARIGIASWGRFDLHRRLGPGLRDWYDTLARLDPGRVSWHHPPEMPPTVARDRYDTDLFGIWMEQLPRHPTSV